MSPARDRVVALDRRDEVARDELRALRVAVRFDVAVEHFGKLRSFPSSNCNNKLIRN